MPEHFSFNSLVIITLLAFIVPITIEKVKIPIPVVVGEILAGVIIGKSGLNLIEPGSWLKFLSEFGFAFLMFLSGLEVDFNLIKRATWQRKKNSKLIDGPLIISALVFLLTLIISFVIAKLFVAANLLNSPWLLTLIISTTSLAIVMPTLKEKEIINTKYGQQVLMSALLADFLTILMITIFVIVISSGPLHEILLIFVLFLAFIFFHKAGILFSDSHIFDELAHATSQIKVRATFALILIFIALAEKLGLEIILGAFLAGAIISLISDDEGSHLNHKLDAIGYGFFIPIFFIMVGVKFNISTLFNTPNIWVFTICLILASYIVKLIPVLLFRRDYSWRETLSAGFLLSSRLSLIIAASAIGLELEIINESINSAIILTAIFTCTASPILFDHLYPEVEREKDRIIIVGSGELTSLLIKRLNTDERIVTIIEKDEDRIERARKLADRVIYGDATNLSVLKSAGIKSADAFLTAAGKDQVNEKICKIVKKNFLIENILALNFNIGNKQKLLDLGVKVVTPSLAAVGLLEKLIKNPRTFSILNEEKLITKEIKLRNSSYIGNKVSELNLPGDCLLMAIERNNELIIPHGYNHLEYGDILTIVGSKECVMTVIKRLKEAS
ncbi:MULTISPECIES: monovalent cation:proton antiporter family protein [unclassified Candidatus Frackibacter]|uniref:monovalent cation:proton antiporter family protein n=1 Tax=unclassified Candidatus Frackibacter TaxID=2648818 RepID=UPI00088BEDB6|nr:MULTISPECIES: monovalent cation:proton antiporter family protein [unclassified Candidatus Frackibacter]SDC26130.1 transporter, CPA2 family [Candidatus Frackibacter sp. WG11]SEM53125.1 transporter, CPA2 family [Candidatus Frackibacter sp. WG12]SFL55372.1 transporter, CPA2 family [Candidatus Frackibacter sp. WG13]